jgi:hypothetical protein
LTAVADIEDGPFTSIPAQAADDKAAGDALQIELHHEFEGRLDRKIAQLRELLTPFGLALVLLTAAGAASAADKKALTLEEHMAARFPQAVRVGDLIGLPLVDGSHSTLGFVREVVRGKNDKVELIVGYGGIFSYLGWAIRPVAVPIEVVGIRGRELASLDMPKSEYAAAPAWHDDGASVLAPNTTILVALCRGY